jgi:hypothetical protein
MPATMIDAHFDKKPEGLRILYDRLVALTENFGPVEQDPKKTSIHLNRKTAFAGIAVRKDCLVLTIKSDKPLKSKRLFKSEQTSAQRFHHEIKLVKPSELASEVKGWLKRAYELSE